MKLQTRLAAKVLNNAGVISNPTDTIQGITCLPKFASSMYRLVQLKQRSNTKGLILLANDVRYFSKYVERIDLLEKIQIEAQPTTYLLKASKSAPGLLTGEFDTIALRLTNNELIADLCSKTHSALVSSSANTSGKNSAQSVLNLKVFFKDELDFIIAPKNYNTQASKIINLQTGERVR